MKVQPVSENHLASLLNGMAASLLTAAELFGKDADLDRSDLLGDIDLGAARQAFDLAKAYAADILAMGRYDPLLQAGPGVALNRIATLLRNGDLVIEERFVPTLGRLVDAALAIPQGATTGDAVIAFDDDYEQAADRLRLVAARAR